MHVSVLLQETLQYLAIKPDGVYLDGTFGAGGTSRAILDKLSNKGKLFACDLDPEVAKIASKFAKKYPNFKFYQINFADFEQILFTEKIFNLDGIILDLGISSIQLGDEKRGFSLKSQKLDMRMDQVHQSQTASDIINQYSEDELSRIFKILGEQPYACRFASEIIKTRREKKITTPEDLEEITRKFIPPSWSKKRREHYLINILRALRIEVNQELSALNRFLPKAVNALKTSGRVVIISFHSLEDRVIKTNFVNFARGCICPPDFPVCMCNQKPQLKILTKKPVTPKALELKENPRSRSAKLRAAEKLID